MSKVSSMMTVGKNSLSNSQTALQTVAHNIANKSTEGYSRQRVDLVANPPTGVGQLQIGTGAKATQITRTNNPWLEKQIQRENTNLGFADARADALARVEQVYNEQTNKGLNQYMTDFFNGFRELSANPESMAGRTLVRESSVSLTNDFHRVVGELRGVQHDLDGQVLTTVDEINQMTKEIADLNIRVAQIEVQGVPANDERDRRDTLVKKLGEKVEVNWSEGPSGMVSVTAGRMAVLVSGTESADLHAKYDRDRVELFFSPTDSGTKFNVTNHITGGRLGGVLEVRDKIVEDALSKVDRLAFNFASEVNKAHGEGFDRYGQQGNLFFEDPMEMKGAAERIGVSETVFNDPGRIAAAARPDSPGDNTVSNMISALQYQKVMDDGVSTFDDFYNAQVGQIGTVAHRAVKSQESQKNIMAQMTNLRESISGVSLDEETTKMIEFQKAYDASARLIRTADEMLETVLNIKRM